jgi:hypothetical protein
MKKNNLLLEYCIEVIKEMAGRRLGGRSLSRRPTTRAAAAPRKRGTRVSEETHRPIIISILDDLRKLGEDEVPEFWKGMKDFVAFERIDDTSFQRKYIKDRFLDTNDLNGLAVYNNSRDLEFINIGGRLGEYKIPVTYILASDIVESTEGVTRNNLRRKFSPSHGYMFTSVEIREKIRQAFRDIGLAAISSDIVNVYNTEAVHMKFVRLFGRMKWNDTLRQLGYTPQISEEEARNMIRANTGTIRDRDNIRGDAPGINADLEQIMASGNRAYYLEFNLDQFNKTISGFAENLGGGEEVPFTFKIIMDAWSKYSDIKGLDFLRMIYAVREGKNAEVEKELRHYIAKGYHNFIEDKITGSITGQTPRPEFIQYKITRDIEVNDQGYPTNLSDQELTMYYGAIYRDINFIEITLRHIINAQKKREKLGLNKPENAGGHVQVPMWAQKGDSVFARAFAKSWKQTHSN